MLTIATVLSLPAYGHEIIPGYWCAEVEITPKIIDTFNFDAQKLKDLINKCGMVDKGKDEWHMTAEAIYYYCNSLLRRGPSENPLVIPFVTAPQSFNDHDHHTAYGIEQGLEGSCVICIPIER
ncbi:MAG: hypothetical protein E6Q88_04930 [Lysobacteraceae bacterium]|nr:MAG: hypothetical protein E6Q88_04930 [Xanthomonadaceae bacterium]